MADFVVGLTGGIASGKSEVSRRFEALGIVVADADVAAREVVAPGSEGLAEIVAAFGLDVLTPDGLLDRAAMRHRIFVNKTARSQLEAIIHPRVRTYLQDACGNASGPYAIAAIPLLVEVGPTYSWLSRVLVIDTTQAIQQTRLLQRDGIDVELAKKMISAQASRKERLAMADDVIVNSGPLITIEHHVATLNSAYRFLAKRKKH